MLVFSDNPAASRTSEGEPSLEQVARAIRALEGQPIEYGLAMKLSEVLKDIEASRLGRR